MALSHDARIELALAEIGEETAPNYAHFARKYEFNENHNNSSDICAA
jgi:hypothetical protein